jgi:hypothetical protein
MKFLFESWKRYINETLDKSKVEKYLIDFELKYPILSEIGSYINYDTIKIVDNVATAIFTHPIAYTGVQFVGNSSELEKKFKQENPNNIETKANIKFKFEKSKNYNILSVDYYIPITVYENGIDEDDEAEIIEKLEMIENFHEKVVEPFFLRNNNLFVSNKQLKLRLSERKLGKPSSEKNLGDWFKRKGAPGKTGGWVDCNTCHNGKCKPCGRQEGEKRSKYPRCRPTPSQCKGYKRRHSNLQREE